MENKKFKKKIVGGFDKNEVIDYIDRLQKEQIQKPDEDKYLEEIERLKAERDTLADALAKANEQLKKLSDPLTGSNSVIASSIAHSKSHFDSIVTLSDEVRNETAENLSRVSDDVAQMLENAAEMKSSFLSAAEKLNGDLEALKSYVEKTSPFFRDDRGQLGEIREKADREDSSIKKVLEEGFKLLEEATAHQSKIDKILQNIK